MSPRLRIALPAMLVVLVVGAGLALSGGLGDGGSPGSSPGAAGPGAPTGGPPTVAPTPTPRPEVGGLELYGYLPYWRMNDGTAAYLRDVPLSTIALFSVSAKRDGSINTSPIGFGRIAGPIGRQVIAEAHQRKVRVELVFSSFGDRKNAVFFGRKPGRGGGPPTASPGASPVASPEPSPSPAVPSEPPWERAVDELVGLALDLDVDGINVDVERLDEADRDAYGEFLGALRKALLDAKPKARVTVATEAGERGVGNAAAAAAAGVDRIFLMGYDYHWSGSQPGASSPVDRIDGVYDLGWSIERYVEAGVPRDKILLGLPLYGMTWRTRGPERWAPVVGNGRSWILDGNLDVLLDPEFEPQRDPIEHAEFFVEQDGKTWLQTYYDSPATLRLKLALARDQGFAGGGFWAIGYEQGVPGYLELMADFRDGKVERSEAPPLP
jgi:glycosyl hydrolase family 18 (putative chitinase)